MFRLIFILCAAFLFLSGCTTTPDGPQTAVNLPAQLERLTTVKQWQIKGKMAIRDQRQAVSATLNWKTNQPDFAFRLTNMLGITLADVNYEHGEAILEADDKTYTDSDPTRLIYNVTGWHIPVDRLLNWVKGLPLQQDKYVLNDKQLLASLSPGCKTCGEWQVSYNNYGNVEGVWLPHQLTLTQPNNPDMLIKIRIDQWKITQ